MGTIHGTSWRYSPHTRDEGTVRPTEGNDWKDLRVSQRVPWVPIHEYDWESTDDNESRAYIFMYKSQETGKDNGWKSLFFRLFQLLFADSDGFVWNSKQNGSSNSLLKPFCLRSETLSNSERVLLNNLTIFVLFSGSFYSILLLGFYFITLQINELCKTQD